VRGGSRKLIEEVRYWTRTEIHPSLNRSSARYCFVFLFELSQLAVPRISYRGRLTGSFMSDTVSTSFRRRLFGRAEQRDRHRDSAHPIFRPDFSIAPSSKVDFRPGIDSNDLTATNSEKGRTTPRTVDGNRFLQKTPQDIKLPTGDPDPRRKPVPSTAYG
jgi:hypothetical protein